MKACKVCSIEVSDDVPHWINHCEGEPEMYTCDFCYKEAGIKRYLKTGELITSLTMDAWSCKYYHEEAGLDRIRKESRDFFVKNKDVLFSIAKDYEEVEKAAREFEIAVWLPKLQLSYKNTQDRGHCATADGFKALLWGSAGRVLLTLQDEHDKDHPESKFGGANVTLIFDEDSPTPRGGVQGICASKKEALALLKFATEQMPEMKSDAKVTMAGL